MIHPILSIPVDQPEQLFSGTEVEAKAQRRQLLRQYHPDHNDASDAADAAAHIGILYDETLKRIKAGTWTSKDTLTFTAADGIIHSYAFVKRHSIDIGELFIGPLVVFKVLDANTDLIERAAIGISRLKFHHKKMEDEFRPQVPGQASIVKSRDSTYVVVPNTERLVLLHDLLPLAPKHVAWVISRLLNLRCYLDYTGMMCGGIDTRSIFVDPANHTIRLLGGWEYSAPIGQRMVALPGKALSMLPSGLLKTKVGDSRIDGEMIRYLAREMLPATAPDPMLEWSQFPAGEDPIVDFTYWKDSVLTKSFGPPKFIELDADYNSVYN